MAVTETDSYRVQEGNGTKVAFDFAFKIFAETDIKVYTELTAGVFTLRTLTTDYTVEFDTKAETGTVTYVVHPADPAYDPAVPDGLDSIVIRRTPDTQGSTFPRAAVMPEQAIENALDKLTLEVQEIERNLERAPKVIAIPIPDGEIIIEAPVEGKGVKWEADGDDWNLVNTTYDLDVAAEEAAASAAAALVSQNAASASAAAAAVSAAAAVTSASEAAASAVAAAASAAIAVAEHEGLFVDRPATPATVYHYWATDYEQMFRYSPLAGKWFMVG